MKVAVIGSREITINNMGDYLTDCDEVVSGGARGVDTSAREYALKEGLNLTEFLPNYKLYGKRAPMVRNKLIVDYADRVLAFWDGKSKGTLSVINYAKKQNKPCEIVIIKGE